jgi:hypothetical protein
MVIRAVQQRSAIIQKPLRRQADKTWHRQTSIPSQLHKRLALLRRHTNLEACVVHARKLRADKNTATHIEWGAKTADRSPYQ